MGKRGPKKKPTAIKVMQGIPGGKHKLLPHEPMPELVTEADLPERKELGEVARQVWDELVPKLLRLNLLSELDQKTFCRYCDIFQKWYEAKQFLDQNGSTYESINRHTGSVSIKPYPQVGIYSTLSKELGRLEGHFGLTPSARASISIEPPKAQKDISKQLFG